MVLSDNDRVVFCYTMYPLRKGLILKRSLAAHSKRIACDSAGLSEIRQEGHGAWSPSRCDWRISIALTTLVNKKNVSSY